MVQYSLFCFDVTRKTLQVPNNFHRVAIRMSFFSINGTVLFCFDMIQEIITYKFVIISRVTIGAFFPTNGTVYNPCFALI